MDMNGISYPNIFPEPASHRLDGLTVSAMMIGPGNICMGKDGRAVRNQPLALRHDIVHTGRLKDARDKEPEIRKVLPPDHGGYRPGNQWEWTQIGMGESVKFIGKFGKVQK